MNPDDFTNYIRLRNWKRNSELIDFANIPQPVVDRILTFYHKCRPQPCLNLSYFSQHGIPEILDEFA
jgi:hypothetical protein